MSKKEEIEKLVALQELDSTLLDLEDAVAAIPAELERAEGEKREKEFSLEELKKAHINLKLERRKKETGLKDLETRTKQLQSKQTEIKTNKEYLALQDEIDAFKRKISDMEDETLAIIDNDEGMTEREKVLAAEVEAATRSLEAKKKELLAKQREIGERAKVKQEERDAFAKTVDPSALALYDTVREHKKDGIAVCKLDLRESHHICTGCSVFTPSYLAEKVHRKDEIVQCENCRRILC